MVVKNWTSNLFEGNIGRAISVKIDLKETQARGQ